MSRKNMIKDSNDFPWEIILGSDGKNARKYIDTYFVEDVETSQDIFNLNILKMVCKVLDISVSNKPKHKLLDKIGTKILEIRTELRSIKNEEKKEEHRIKLIKYFKKSLNKIENKEVITTEKPIKPSLEEIPIIIEEEKYQQEEKYQEFIEDIGETIQEKIEEIFIEQKDQQIEKIEEIIQEVAPKITEQNEQQLEKIEEIIQQVLPQITEKNEQQLEKIEEIIQQVLPQISEQNDENKNNNEILKGVHEIIQESVNLLGGEIVKEGRERKKQNNEIINNINDIRNDINNTLIKVNDTVNDINKVKNDMFNSVSIFIQMENNIKNLFENGFDKINNRIILLEDSIKNEIDKLNLRIDNIQQNELKIEVEKKQEIIEIKDNIINILDNEKTTLNTLLNTIEEDKEIIQQEIIEAEKENKKDLVENLENELERLEDKKDDLIEEIKNKKEAIEEIIETEKISENIISEISKINTIESDIILSEIEKLPELKIEFDNKEIPLPKESPRPTDQYKEEMEESKIIQRCFTKTNYLSFEEMAQDLSCDNGQICDINVKECVNITPEEPYEEIYIGNKLLKLKGSDNIINVLKDQIVLIKEKERIVQEEQQKKKILEIKQKDKPSLMDIVTQAKKLSSTSILDSKVSSQQLNIANKEMLEKIKKCFK
jgi:hypothetical protein